MSIINGNHIYIYREREEETKKKTELIKEVTVKRKTRQVENE